LPKVDIGQALVAGQESGFLRGVGEQVGQGMVSVAIVEGMAFAVEEEGAMGGVDDLARE